MQKCPKVLIASQDDMTATATITAVRTGLIIKLGSKKMFAASSAMSAFTKDADIVYEIRFLHSGRNLRIMKPFYAVFFGRLRRPLHHGDTEARRKTYVVNCISKFKM